MEININDRPFNAIMNGIKNIEVRVNRDKYATLKSGDDIKFINSDKSLLCTVVEVNKYKNVRELLSNEDITKTLSSGLDLENGIISIESISNYRELIPIYGVLAIHIKLKI